MLRFLTLLACVFSCAAALPDLVIFDEDDPLGPKYYDASVGFQRAPSALRLLARSGDKMPVTTNAAASGQFSGVIEWKSRRDGDWAMHIFRPGFPLINAAKYSSLHLALNGPAAIRVEALPDLELQDLVGSVAKVALRDFLPDGLDQDLTTWQHVEIPLSSFRVGEKFDAALIKHLTLRQPSSLASSEEEVPQTHMMWIDAVHLRAADRLIITEPPRAPHGLVGREGDRSVTLHWEAVPTAASYHVERAETEKGPFFELPSSPVQIQSIADNLVENGRSYFYRVRAANQAGLGPASSLLRRTPRAFATDDDFLEYVQAASFDYFWYEANPVNGLVRDRSQPWSPMSTAATGFGLTAIGIGIDHGWITREQGRDRVVRCLRTLWHAPQGPALSGTTGFGGWYYHFLDFSEATRFGSSELSSIDTALLLAGVLYVKEYFSGDHPLEQEIRQLAQNIFARVDWSWMLNGGATLSMGWHPERGFLPARWKGYNEASMLYAFALGAEGANRLEKRHWTEWTRTYDWKTSYGYSFVHFAPLFGHQYSACWIDFRGIADEYMREKGLSYFENSRRATLAQRAYCMANPGGFQGYGPNIWGLTACDGPGSERAHSYMARGAPPPENDDGTIAPTAAGGSLPFAPAECGRALRAFYDQLRERIWCGYGFRDAFNLHEDWWGSDVIGIDQGPILIMAENLRTGRVWELMRRNSIVSRGLNEAGFQPLPTGTPTPK